MSSDTIKKALRYDNEGVEDFLAHFRGGIEILATETMYDEDGSPHSVIDQETVHRLESKLIDKFHKFIMAQDL